jgi:hypothetical protein
MGDNRQGEFLLMEVQQDFFCKKLGSGRDPSTGDSCPVCFEFGKRSRFFEYLSERLADKYCRVARGHRCSLSPDRDQSLDLVNVLDLEKRRRGYHPSPRNQ